MESAKDLHRSLVFARSVLTEDCFITRGRGGGGLVRAAGRTADNRGDDES